MGSRAKRVREGKSAPEPKADKPLPVHCFPPIPKLDGVDAAFGNIDHMPTYASVPEEFRRTHSNPYTTFISDWFFKGRTDADMARLVARPGVDRGPALLAISAILRSFAPKHEHKTAGAAYLLYQWFELTP